MQEGRNVLCTSFIYLTLVLHLFQQLSTLYVLHSLEQTDNGVDKSTELTSEKLNRMINCMVSGYLGNPLHIVVRGPLVNPDFCTRSNMGCNGCYYCSCSPVLDQFHVAILWQALRMCPPSQIPIVLVPFDGHDHSAWDNNKYMEK